MDPKVGNPSATSELSDDSQDASQSHQRLTTPAPVPYVQAYPSEAQGSAYPSADRQQYAGEQRPLDTGRHDSHGLNPYSATVDAVVHGPGGGLPHKPGLDQQGASTDAKATGYTPPLPPRRICRDFGEDDPSNPIHYTRDPHKLVGYLVPFPKPRLQSFDPSRIPDRFLIYTPPPPPLSRPGQGEEEGKFHKVQRKWQEEVHEAKTSTAKTASWKGIKSAATKGISKAMSYTTTSSLDFLTRVSGDKPESPGDHHAQDGVEEGEIVHKTVGLEEMVLVYPSTMGLNQEQIREEFISTMLRSKSKAQKDAIIATGLIPVSFAIDILATLIWPFGGLGEIDSVWAYSSIRGAKTARSVTSRLSSSSHSGNHEEDKLQLTFQQSQRLEILRQYLEAACHKTEPKMFPSTSTAPSETDVLEAIGWKPSQTGAAEENWEDEAWEISEVKNDLRMVMTKGAREWKKWLDRFEKDPEKALKK